LKKYWRFLIPILILAGVLSYKFALAKYQFDPAPPANSAAVMNVTGDKPTEPAQPSPNAGNNNTTVKSNSAGTGTGGSSTAKPTASITILMYHEIGTGGNSLFVPTEKFRAQMKYLHNSGYNPVTMAEAYKMVSSGNVPAKTVVLTFDDGYTSFYTQAWPIMKEYGFTGTVYVVSSYTGKYNYLTWEQMQTLNQAGIEIGSHTKNHIDLKAAGDAALVEEIAGSKKAIEENLGTPVYSFCYPIGAYDNRTPAAVKQAGYTTATTVNFGYFSTKTDHYLVPRVRVPGWISLEGFAKNIP